jgi:hypothetical protein
MIRPTSVASGGWSCSPITQERSTKHYHLLCPGNAFNKRLTMGATVFSLISPRQYSGINHSPSRLVPLLVLHRLQHRATFRCIIVRSSHRSLSKCSQVAILLFPRGADDFVNGFLQYTQRRSLALTCFSSSSGIPHLFMALNPCPQFVLFSALNDTNQEWW